MLTCRCEHCNNTFDAQPGQFRNCPYCRKALLVYKCGSCMKASGLLMQRRSTACPRCNTRVRPTERLQLEQGPLLLAPPSTPTLVVRRRPLVQMMPLQLQPRLLTVLEQMEQARGVHTIVLFRVCSKEEAESTVQTLLAGGRRRELARFKPSEEEAVNQVGNSESMLHSSGHVDNRLLVLQKKGFMTTSSSSQPERTVVEYSDKIASQFSGYVVQIEVNINFTVQGSGLSYERGVILQVGTPLKSAVIIKVLKSSLTSGLDFKPSLDPFSKKGPPGGGSGRGGFGGGLGKSLFLKIDK